MYNKTFLFTAIGPLNLHRKFLLGDKFCTVIFTHVPHCAQIFTQQVPFFAEVINVWPHANWTMVTHNLTTKLKLRYKVFL